VEALNAIGPPLRRAMVAGHQNANESMLPGFLEQLVSPLQGAGIGQPYIAARNENSRPVNALEAMLQHWPVVFR
jgi:hypothetical protein